MKEVTRRRFLQAAGGTALLGTGAVLADQLRARGAFAQTPPEGEDDTMEPQAETTRVRRWAMVIDLRKCDGCVDQGVPPQCTQYCVWGHFIPENQQWMEVYRHNELEGIPEASGHFMPVPCQQCENAPCVNVCPVGATFATPNGEVLIDQDRCIGCRFCMAACPYDRRFFNWEEPEQLPQIQNSEYNIFHQTPAKKGTVMKCNFCPERTAAGGVPLCVEACPHAGIYFGDLEEDIATNGDEVVQLSRFLEDNGAFRFKEELGTKPRVWYIPGRTEKGDVKEDEERTFPTTSGQAFRKEEIEWPWRKMVAEMKGLPPAAATSDSEGGM